MRLRRIHTADSSSNNNRCGSSRNSRCIRTASSSVLLLLLVALGVTLLVVATSLLQQQQQQLLQYNPVRQALLGFESSYAPQDRRRRRDDSRIPNPDDDDEGIEESTTSSVTGIITHETTSLQQRQRDDTTPRDPTLVTTTSTSAAATTITTTVMTRSETKAELIARLYPNEIAIPNPTTVADGVTTFAACLLVMDDNHRLTEWLAYHYHVLPLRYMIIAIDERSRTSPTHLLNEWRQRNMTIIEWNDADFWHRKDGSTLQPLPQTGAPFQQKRDRHRARQKYFYKQCLIQMTKANRTWVSLHDSDEYLVYNHHHSPRSPKSSSSSSSSTTRRTSQKRTGGSTSGGGSGGSTDTAARPPPPSTAEAGAMIRYIEHERAMGRSYYQSACIGVPRLIFGADPKRIDPLRVIQSVPDVLVQQQPLHSTTTATTSSSSSSSSLTKPAVNTGLAYQMDTLVYRHHAQRNDFVKNALGKVLIDVSRVNVARTPYFMSLHRPIKSICPPPWHKDADSGLRINHYLGSWESYSFRDDARRGGERSWEQWEYKATTVTDDSSSSRSSTGSSSSLNTKATDTDNTDDAIRPWVQGLVEQEGEARAVEMLRHVGLPTTYRNADTESWRLLPDKLAAILNTPTSSTQDNKAIAFEDWVRDKYKQQQQQTGGAAAQSGPAKAAQTVVSKE